MKYNTSYNSTLVSPYSYLEFLIFHFLYVVVTIGFIRKKPVGYERDGFVTLTVGVLSGDLQRDVVVSLHSDDSHIQNGARGIHNHIRLHIVCV